MTETPSAAVRQGSMARVVLPVVSARTWLAVIHLLTGFWTGLAAFLAIVIGAVLGTSLLALFLVGFAILAATYWLAGQFAILERARFALMLGERIPAPLRDPDPPPQWWRRAWGLLAGPVARKQLGYALLRFPLSVVQAAIVLATWALALALICLPAYNSSLPAGGIMLGGIVLRGPAVAAAAVILGAAMLLTAPWVTAFLAAADVSVARYLLGPTGRADLTARIGQLERSRAGVVDAAQAERLRIERDLHDGAQQRLVSLAMELGRARAKFADDPQAAQAIVEDAHRQAKEALAELRNLVRGVHPPVLSDRGLDAALSGLAALSPIPVTVRVQLAGRPEPQVEAIAYFVVAEALTNIAKHASASRAEVAVDQPGNVLRVIIGDDGVGGADPAGQGLAGLARRVAGVDGWLSVDSPPGGPTSIEVQLPCGS
jgi:signal transduction histidine kinase